MWIWMFVKVGIFVEWFITVIFKKRVISFNISFNRVTCHQPKLLRSEMLVQYIMGFKNFWLSEYKKAPFHHVESSQKCFGFGFKIGHEQSFQWSIEKMLHKMPRYSLFWGGEVMKLFWPYFVIWSMFISKQFAAVATRDLFPQSRSCRWASRTFCIELSPEYCAHNGTVQISYSSYNELGHP